MVLPLYEKISRYWDLEIGALITLTGCMKSGKTREQKLAAESCIRAGIPFEFFTHDIDIGRRISPTTFMYSDHGVVSIPEKFFMNTSDLEKAVSRERQALFVNEIQFADEPIIAFLLNYIKQGNQAVVSGLNLTSEDIPFPFRMSDDTEKKLSTVTMADLLAKSTDIFTLHAHCEYVNSGSRCKNDAVYSRFIGQKAGTIQVGSDTYSVRCIKHENLAQFPP